MFSGIECLREALAILDTAVADRFSFALGVKYSLMASRNECLISLMACSSLSLVGCLLPGPWYSFKDISAR